MPTSWCKFSRETGTPYRRHRVFGQETFAKTRCFGKVSPCAGYLRHLFIKLEMCASIISLASHLAFTKRGSCQEDREQASACSLNTHASLSATKQMDDVFSSSVKRKQGRERSNTLSIWHGHFAVPHELHSQ